MKFLKKWDPLREIFENFLEEDLSLLSPKLATDIYETNNDVIVEIQLPGYKKEDLKISFQDNYLRIEGSVNEEKEEKEKNYWRKEIRRGSFAKVIPLPVEVNSKNSKATFENGILKIVLPKIKISEEESEEIKIE